MQIVINIMFVVTIGIAIFFWVKYEKECEHSYELEDKLCEAKCELKEKAQLVIIADLIHEYKKGGNVYTIMRKISDLVLSNKKDISADQSH